MGLNNHLSNCAFVRLAPMITKDMKLNQNLILKMHVLFISLFDDLTDNGILEEEIKYIRYMLNNKPVTKFAGIENPNKVDAQGTLNDIVEDLDLNSLKPSESKSGNEYLVKVYKELINGNFDGSSALWYFNEWLQNQSPNSTTRKTTWNDLHKLYSTKIRTFNA